MWNFNFNLNYDVVGNLWNALAFLSIICEFYWLALICIILGMYNTEEDKHYEEQIIELTEEKKFFTEDFDEQKIFQIYNDRNWWAKPQATEELEEFVGSEVDELETRIREYWEIPASNAVSNNYWLVPENESFSYAAKSHEFILERIKLEFYHHQYLLYFQMARKRRNGFFWKTYYSAYELSYNTFLYNAMFSFYYLSPQDHSYETQSNEILMKTLSKKKIKLLENNIENMFYNDGGLNIERRKNLKNLSNIDLKERIKI